MSLSVITAITNSNDDSGISLEDASLDFNFCLSLLLLLFDKTAGEEARRQLPQECCEQYWTSPGGNTQQGTNYTATCLPSRKLSKLDEPDIQDTVGEAGTSS